LPLFHLRLVMTAAEIADMGSGDYTRDGILTVLLRQTQPPGTDGEAVMHAHARTVENALRADPPDLSGTVFDIAPGQVEPDVTTGDTRAAMAEATFPVVLIE